jgi:Bax protein
MRRINYLIPLFILIYLPGCSQDENKTSDPSTQQETESDEADTLVYSMPIPYSTIKDTISDSQKVPIRGYKDILELFEKLNYTPETWQAGIREIPRVYGTIVGEKWGSTTANEIEVLQKKRIFFRVLAPIILNSNELILKDRKRLESIRSDYRKKNTIREKDQKWILKLAKVYRADKPDGQVTEKILDDLWEKVDIVPPSLALSQGAEESGWGTSRFAAVGNAIYGQWTWGENAITPKRQRKELGNYGIAAFETMQESVAGYMLNLNTHPAYADLRKKRAELRKKGEKISGVVLAEQLTRYSERGEEYVKTLKSLMEYNRLAPTDDAYLSKDPAIYMVSATD